MEIYVYEKLMEALKAMTVQLETLQAQVAVNNTLVGSAITLIQGLAAQIIALKDDPVALQQLADDLKAKDQELSDALMANTPSA